MSRLNTIEKECQDVLVVVRDTLTNPRHEAPKRSYMDLMTLVRDVLVKLQNKEYGCSTGKHAGPCACIGDLDGGLTPRPGR